MHTGSEQKVVVVVKPFTTSLRRRIGIAHRVVAPNTCNERKFILNGVGIFGKQTRLDHIKYTAQITILKLYTYLFAHSAHPHRATHIERRAATKIVQISQVGPRRSLPTLVGVFSKIGVHIEVVHIDHQGQTRTLLLFVLLVPHGCTDGFAHLQVAVQPLVFNLRAVDVSSLNLVELIGGVAHLSAHAVLIDKPPTPAPLRAVGSLIEPTVGHVYLAGHRQVAEAVAIVVQGLSVARVVQQHIGSQSLLLVKCKRHSDINLGFELVVEVEVKEEFLLVGGLAVFEVNLAGHSLVARSNRSNTLRHLNRVEPHTGSIVQTIGRANATHNRPVFVENLGVGTRQAEHLDLATAAHSIAVTHRHRSRVLEALGQVAASHLTQARKANHLLLAYAALLNEVAAHLALDLHLVDALTFGHGEVHLGSTRSYLNHLLGTAQVGSHQAVVVFHSVEGVVTIHVGGCTHGRALPIDACTHKGLTRLVAHHTADVLRRGHSPNRQQYQQ